MRLIYGREGLLLLLFGGGGVNLCACCCCCCIIYARVNRNAKSLASLPELQKNTLVNSCSLVDVGVDVDDSNGGFGKVDNNCCASSVMMGCKYRVLVLMSDSCWVTTCTNDG